jgi:hypothetical protein
VLAVGWPDPARALAAIAMALLIVAFLRRWTGPPPAAAASAALGFGGGVALHIQPELLPVIGGCVAFEAWWRRQGRPWRGIVALTGGLTLAMVPWGVRNCRMLHAPVFIRSNLGLELRMAFHEGAAADIDVSVARGGTRHPRSSVTEALRLRELGEVAYMREARDEALAYIRTHPGQTARLVAGRFFRFWLGPLDRPGTAALVSLLTLVAAMGVVRALPALTIPQRAALLIPLLTFPPVYYVMSYMADYRIPLDWLILLCAGAAVAGVARAPASSGPAAPPSP